MNWPPGYRYQVGGATKNMQESFGYALSALAMAVILLVNETLVLFRCLRAQPSGIALEAFPGDDRRLPQAVWQAYDWSIPHCILRGDNQPIALA